MFRERLEKVALAHRAGCAGEPGRQLDDTWLQDIEPALRRAAGMAIAIVAPDGSVPHLHYDEQSLADSLGAVQGRQVRQWLEARDWGKELRIGEAFERATRDGVVCRQAVVAGESEAMLEQTVVPIGAGAVAGPVLVAMREMSDWHRYANGVERLSRFYEVTLNTMAEGLLGIDAGGAIDFSNPAAARLLGWAIEDMIGCAAGHVLGTDGPFDQAEGGAGVAWFTQRGGNPFIAEFRISPRQDDDATQGAVMVFADITERQAAERELRESNVRLHEALLALDATRQQLFMADKMATIGRLAAGIAHEINNPLAFISANLRRMEIYSEELLRAAEVGLRGETKNDAASDLEFLRQDIPALCAESRDGIARIAHIVQSLRTFSQVDLNREWGLADLNVGLDSVLSLIAHEIGAGVEIVRETSPLPLIECQVGQINQVFFNLLSNAIRAVGGNGKIRLGSGVAGNDVWVEVADDGCGIAPEHQERLFEPFFTTCAVGQGIGLGLSVAYGIIKQHNGTLSVSPRAGGGTVFRIVLPATPKSGMPPFSPGNGEIAECRP